MQTTSENPISPGTANTDKEDLTISPGKAQLLSLLYFLPAALLFGLPFFLIWPEKFSKAAYKASLPQDMSSLAVFALFLLVIIAGIVTHELVHGITWSRFAREGLRSISFGIIWKSFTPYCHCKEPLKVNAYIIGALMPGIILGFLPLIVALFSGNLMIFCFGLFFTLAAAGDFMVVALLRKTNARFRVQDHPSKIGCILYKTEDNEPVI